MNKSGSDTEWLSTGFFVLSHVFCFILGIITSLNVQGIGFGSIAEASSIKYKIEKESCDEQLIYQCRLGKKTACGLFIWSNENGSTSYANNQV